MDTPRSARRTQRRIGWIVVLAVLLLVGYSVVVVARDMLRPRPMVTIGKAMFQAEVAKTPDERYRGLSGKASLPRDRGMLFVFDNDERWAMVMRDMRFPIDMIWLNAQKKVVHVVRDAQPDAEPYDEHKPPVSARYMLEVPAGSAKEFGIKPGAVASFELEPRP